MTRSAILASLFVLSFPARAAEEDRLPAARFAFARPKETTIEQAVSRLGDPFSRFPTRVVEGEIDLFPRAHDLASLDDLHDRAAKRKTGLVKVEVLKWEIAKLSTEMAVFVFRGGKLWYAMYPSSPSESTPEKLEARYGKKPKKGVREAQMGDVVFSADVWVFPDLGVGYAAREGGEIDQKIVFPPVKP